MRDLIRTKWAAVGAAVAVTLGAGGVSLTQAAISSGDKPVVVTVDATRILDTRTGLGLAGGRFVDSSPQELQVTGDVPIAPSGTATVVPPGALGVLVNVTVVAPNSKGFLSLRAGGAAGTPATSTVNFEAGITTPNAATVDLSGAGKVQIWLETDNDGGSAHVLLDIVGYTVDHNHDDRYYTEAEVDTATYYTIETLDGPGVETGSNSIPAGAMRLVGTLGSFTKDRDDTDVKITWMTQVRASGIWCSIQLRVDGVHGGGQINIGNPDAVPMTMVGLFDSLSAGSHDVQVWVQNNVSCQYNVGNFRDTVNIEEFTTS